MMPPCWCPSSKLEASVSVRSRVQSREVAVIAAWVLLGRDTPSWLRAGWGPVQQPDAFSQPLLGATNVQVLTAWLGPEDRGAALQAGSAPALKKEQPVHGMGVTADTLAAQDIMGGPRRTRGAAGAMPIAVILGLLRAHCRTRWWRRWASAAATPCGSTFRRSWSPALACAESGAVYAVGRCKSVGGAKWVSMTCSLHSLLAIPAVSSESLQIFDHDLPPFLTAHLLPNSRPCPFPLPV